MAASTCASPAGRIWPSAIIRPARPLLLADHADLRRRGWKRNHGTPYWFKGDTRDAFEIGAALEREDAESELNKIDAALDDIERRIASLRAKRKERA